MSKWSKEVEKILNELSKQYLGKFFIDKAQPGVFQVLDVIKEPGFVYASNGKIMIRRALSEINIHNLDSVTCVDNEAIKP